MPPQACTVIFEFCPVVLQRTRFLSASKTLFLCTPFGFCLGVHPQFGVQSGKKMLEMLFSGQKQY